MILQELEGLEHSVTANKSEVTQRACICRNSQYLKHSQALENVIQNYHDH